MTSSRASLPPGCHQAHGALFRRGVRLSLSVFLLILGMCSHRGSWTHKGPACRERAEDGTLRLQGGASPGALGGLRCQAQPGIGSVTLEKPHALAELHIILG